MVSRQKINKQYHCSYALNYHLVVVTKYRRKCITSDMMARLREIAVDRCVGWGGELLEMNGEQDHIHLLISLPPTAELSRFVNNFKTTTSRLIRRDFSEHLKPFYWKPVFWSRSYCIVSCGGAPLEIVKQYIENQNEPI
jgi:putative transposase